MSINKKLAGVKIVFCAPNMCIYGIPYKMRVGIGQEPIHIWKAQTTPDRTRPFTHGATVPMPGAPDDWVVLTVYDHEDTEDAEVLRKFWLKLQKHDFLPRYIQEWTELPEDFWKTEE